MVPLMFVVTLCVALLLLSIALVLLLSELIGSILAALIAVGMAMLLISGIIYVTSLRGAIRRLQQRLNTIYDVSTIIVLIYQRTTNLLSSLRKFWQ